LSPRVALREIVAGCARVYLDSFLFLRPLRHRSSSARAFWQGGRGWHLSSCFILFAYARRGFWRRFLFRRRFLGFGWFSFLPAGLCRGPFLRYSVPAPVRSPCFRPAAAFGPAMWWFCFLCSFIAAPGRFFSSCRPWPRCSADQPPGPCFWSPQPFRRDSCLRMVRRSRRRSPMAPYRPFRNLELPIVPCLA